jgi:hypothetical protein
MLEQNQDTRAREMRREYLRAWRSRNRDKVRGYNESYWRRRVEKELAAQQEQGEGGTNGG